MEFNLVGLVELRKKAGFARFRIGCLGCAGSRHVWYV